MNANDLNQKLNGAIAEAINEGVNKKQLKLTEMVGILEIHQQNLIAMHAQQQFRIQAATAEAMRNLPEIQKGEK